MAGTSARNRRVIRIDIRDATELFGGRNQAPVVKKEPSQRSRRQEPVKGKPYEINPMAEPWTMLFLNVLGKRIGRAVECGVDDDLATLSSKPGFFDGFDGSGNVVVRANDRRAERQENDNLRSSLLFRSLQGGFQLPDVDAAIAVAFDHMDRLFGQAHDRGCLGDRVMTLNGIKQLGVGKAHQGEMKCR